MTRQQLAFLAREQQLMHATYEAEVLPWGQRSVKVERDVLAHWFSGEPLFIPATVNPYSIDS